MINIKEINEEIKHLENSDCTTYKVCEKLAILYIVKHYFEKEHGQENNTEMVKSSPVTPISNMMGAR